MTVTFTTIKLNLSVKSTDPNILQIFKVLEDINDLGSSDILQIESQFHVNGENADALTQKFRELESLGAIGNYQTNNFINQIQSLKAHYLK